MAEANHLENLLKFEESFGQFHKEDSGSIVFLSENGDLSDEDLSYLDDDLYFKSAGLASSASDNPCPPGTTFLEFRDSLPIKVNEKIYKKIIKNGKGIEVDLERAEVLYDYEMFLEGQEEAFASSFLSERGKINVKEGIEPAPGCFLALASMKKGETALFWISSELMYGKLGCAPRIPGSADILLQAKVLEVAEVKVEEKDRSKVFKKFRKEAHEAMRTAEEYYRSDAPQMSIQIYRKWINKLEDFRMQSDEEEKIQKKMLIKMYQNAAVCYNAIGKPEKTCIMIRQLEKLTSIKGNYKALLEKGRANMMLNDFLFARKHLKAAATIEPGKESIHFALRELDEREMAEINYRKQQEKILLEMEAKVKIHEAEMKKKAEKEYEEQEEFRKKLEEMKVATEAKIEQFKQKGFDKMVLFKGINTEEESEMISQLCKEHQVSLKGFSSIDGASTTYFLVKNS